MPDNVLLSHGETPHYHRRWTLSLLSSAWDQVVRIRYFRQAIPFVFTAFVTWQAIKTKSLT